MTFNENGERKDKLSLACACDVMHSLGTLPARRPSQLKHHNCELNKLLFFIENSVAIIQNRWSALGKFAFI